VPFSFLFKCVPLLLFTFCLLRLLPSILVRCTVEVPGRPKEGNKTNHRQLGAFTVRGGCLFSNTSVRKTTSNPLDS
jgi:hypothetical protein